MKDNEEVFDQLPGQMRLEGIEASPAELGKLVTEVVSNPEKFMTPEELQIHREQMRQPSPIIQPRRRF